MSRNLVILEGNLGADPELTYAGNGTAILRLRLATNEYFNNETKTQWHTVKAFGRVAERISKLAQKGSYVTLQGKIEYGSYENKEGQTVNTVDIIAFNINVVTNRVEQEEGGGSRGSKGGRSRQQEPDEDYDFDPDADLPF